MGAGRLPCGSFEGGDPRDRVARATPRVPWAASRGPGWEIGQATSPSATKLSTLRASSLGTVLSPSVCTARPHNAPLTARRMACVLLGVLLAALAVGCGQGSKTSSEAASTVRARQDALVAFYRAYITALPARKASLEAALQFRSATTGGHVDVGAVGRALGSATAHGRAWQKSMQALPADTGDLQRIRGKFSEAAVDEVQLWRKYSAFLLASAAHGPSTSEAKGVEATKEELEALNKAAQTELSALTERLGGEAALRGRIDFRRLEELRSSLRQQAGG